MKKTLVKSKIVLKNDGRALVTYLWKKTFLFFGYWYPFGPCCGSKISEEKLNKINDNAVSELFMNNFIKGL